MYARIAGLVRVRGRVSSCGLGLSACLSDQLQASPADLCIVSEVANGTGDGVPGLCHSYHGGAVWRHDCPHGACPCD